MRTVFANAEALNSNAKLSKIELMVRRFFIGKSFLWFNINVYVIHLFILDKKMHAVSIIFRNKLLKLLRLGIGEDFLGGAVFYNYSLVEENYSI